MKRLKLFFVLVFLATAGFSQTVTQEIVIDESGLKEEIVEVIAIDSVWAGHRVGFFLMTHGARQYVAYYNANRRMVVGQRDLSDDHFQLYVMPATSRETHGGTSTVLGWDSHNYVTFDIDREGYIHLAGNMHVHPLTYFRSRDPWDITTLSQEMEMVGSEEKQCTYPLFMKNREGELLFHYRDGGSGNGNEIYNIYDTTTKKWRRLLDQNLTNGQGLMNAYQSQPALLKDNWYHVYWVWRDTPDCETNHDLSYMKSPDLIRWFNAFGEPVELPATIDNRSLIVDPVPPGGGIINLAARLCLDEDQKPIFAYHKYDEEGNLQFYVAKTEGEQWVSKQVTDWDYRWEFSGRGSINFEVRITGFNLRRDGYYELGYSHVKYGSGVMLLDRDFSIVGKVLKSSQFNDVRVEGVFPGLEVQMSGDQGRSGERGVRYLLKWERLPPNRDRARPKPWPKPSTLYLYKLKNENL